jgi:hypothetical protein
MYCAACGFSKLNPHEFIGGFERGDNLRSWRCRQAEQSRSPEANPEPALRCCWNRSRCATKSPYGSAAELVARVSGVLIGCFATVSRYLPSPSRRPTQSWRTFLRNQASAFGHYSEERSRVCAGLHGQSYWVKLMGSTATQVAAIGAGLWRVRGRQQPALKAPRISLRFAHCDRAAMHRVHRLAAVSGVSRKYAVIVFPFPFRCEVHRMKLGCHQGSDRARLRMLLFAWTKF